MALILKNVFAYTIHCPSLFNITSAVRTSTPTGATGTSDPGEFATFSAAVNSLPNNGSSQTIFIYPGNLHRASTHLLLRLTVRTYHLQLWALRLTSTAHAFEYTTDTFTYKNNQVIIQARIPANSPPP